MHVRTAILEDAPAMIALLEGLVAAGKRRLPADLAYVKAVYIAPKHGVRCSVALDDDGRLLGLQALSIAQPDNPYGTPAGWGSIGTHVAIDAARRGVGRALFAVTKAAAKDAQLDFIEASIGEDNPEGLAYYCAMGFKPHRWPEGRICKKYTVST